jgi:hypothetical protein
LQRAFKDTRPPYNDLMPMLLDFDKSWARFEQGVCYSYFSIAFYGKPFCLEEIDMFQVRNFRFFSYNFFYKKKFKLLLGSFE